MALETATYISDLVSTNPTSSDNLSQGDDHLRLLKSTIKATFPSITGPVTTTQAELNVLDGITASTAELNYVDGVTSNIQTQLNTKAGTGVANTFVSGQQFGTGTGYAEITINGGAGNSRSVVYRSGTGATSPRWTAGADQVAETGSNAGSDYVIARYSDAGAYIDRPLVVYRSTGATELKRLLLTTDLEIAHGGTGASNATDARANLGAAGLGANTFTGQQTFNGGISPGFWVSAQGGTEGGEISLEKAPSGSTLSGNVVIDTAGNLLRVYELGATTRGVYVDLTAQGSQSRLLTEVDPRVRAWVNFNGTGTVAIRASNNVTSITDNGIGNYTVNLTSALPDANYAVSISWQYNAQGEMPGTNSLTASSYVIRCRNVGGSDVDTSVCTSIVVR